MAAPELEPEMIAVGSYEWALRHIEHYGDSDMLPKPFEYEAIKGCRAAVIPELEKINISKFQSRPFQTYLLPKDRGGYRIATRLDPIDVLVFTAAVYEAAPAIEKARVKPTRGIACAYRVDLGPEGRFFSKENGYSIFQFRARRWVEKHPDGFVVMTDIADFYNHINIHRISNALETAAGLSVNRAKAFEHMLLSWTGKQSRGLPPGPSASHILAEIALNDVDQHLMREGYRHARYVDDFRILCTSRVEAEEALHSLSEFLFTSHGLSLASHKTQIVGAANFMKVADDPAAAERAQKGQIIRKAAEEAQALREKEAQEAARAAAEAAAQAAAAKPPETAVDPFEPVMVLEPDDPFRSWFSIDIVAYGEDELEDDDEDEFDVEDDEEEDDDLEEEEEEDDDDEGADDDSVEPVKEVLKRLGPTATAAERQDALARRSAKVTAEAPTPQAPQPPTSIEAPSSPAPQPPAQAPPGTDPPSDTETTKAALISLFAEYLDSDPPRLGNIRYLYRRAALMKLDCLHEPTLENLGGKLLPALRDALHYLQRTTQKAQRKKVARTLLNVAKDRRMRFLPWAQEWLLHVLTTAFFDCARKPIEKLAEKVGKDHDQIGRRVLALVAKAKNDDTWVRLYRNNWNAMPAWDKRALIWAGSTLSSGEQNAWKKLIESGDILDKAVAAYALHPPPQPPPKKPRIKPPPGKGLKLNLKPAAVFVPPAGLKAGLASPGLPTTPPNVSSSGAGSAAPASPKKD